MREEGRCDPTGVRDNWDKDLLSEGIKAKVNRKRHVSFFAWTAETRSTVKMLFILYFASDPESESKPESIRSQESEPESESEQHHHDSVPFGLFETSFFPRSAIDLMLFLFEENQQQNFLIKLVLHCIEHAFSSLEGPGGRFFVNSGLAGGHDRGKAIFKQVCIELQNLI